MLGEKCLSLPAHPCPFPPAELVHQVRVVHHPLDILSQAVHRHALLHSPLSVGLVV